MLRDGEALQEPIPEGNPPEQRAPAASAQRGKEKENNEGRMDEE